MARTKKAPKNRKRAKDNTLIVFLLDRSGSMLSIKEDVEGGFQAFIAEQRKAPGTCHVSLAQFDTEYESVYTRVPVHDSPPLNLQPRGCTALLDSMGRVIRDTEAAINGLPASAKPDNVILAVMTDGLENASREWTRDGIKKLVKEKSADGWEVLYMGANQDAIEIGSSVGIAPSRSITYTTNNADKVFAAMSSSVVEYRAAASQGLDDTVLAFTDQQRDEVVG